MIKKNNKELIVEILDQAQEWGRDEYIQFAKQEGRDVHIVSLADSTPPKNKIEGMWLDLRDICDIVSEKIRNLYPAFLHETVKNTGLLDIVVLNGKVSLYWLMPISEMSVLRNPLIDKIYALLVLVEILKNSNYDSVYLVVDDVLIKENIRQICNQFAVPSLKIKVLKQAKKSYYQGKIQLIYSWAKDLCLTIGHWAVVNLLSIGLHIKEGSFQTVGLTIFPTLWAQNNQGVLKNQVFGDFPEELEKHGRAMMYIAIPVINPRKILMNLKHWREVACSNNIFFSHSLVSIKNLLLIYFRYGWNRRLSKWFQNLKNTNLNIDGVDVNKLVVREFLQEIWSLSVPQTLIVAYASMFALNKNPNISLAVCAFEFQPIEKAFVAGIKSVKPEITTVGLQTSLMGKSHLGYCFLPDQISNKNEINSPYAPLPDYIAAYGNTTYGMLTKVIGKERVVLTGPIRYPYLKLATQSERDFAEKDWRNRLNLKEDAVLALLALPSIREEALTIIEWALSLTKKYPQLYFLVRFHYWAVLTEELEETSLKYFFDRYQIASGDLHELLLASRFIITGTSSVGVEAMVSGCMPISYKPTRRYDFGRIQDVEEGAFFYTSENELEFAMDECVLQSKGFMERKMQWKNLIQRLCNPLDGDASSSFYSWLVKRDVFIPIEKK
ncbi:MAG: hypothetical protein U0Z26_12470 [Anaerolineales bacterium]